MTADRRTLAEVHLLGLIAEAHATPRAISNREEFEGALGAALATGLVAETEATAWRERFDHFDEQFVPPGDAGERQDRALELIDRLLHEAAAAVSTESVDEYLRMEDALHALTAVGAITDAEREWWWRRFADMSGLEVDPDDDEPSERLLRLRGVYTQQPASEEGLRLISVECYDDAIVVRWASRRAPTADPLPGEDRLVLSDDVGTEYLFHYGGSSSGDGPDVVRENGEFTFCPPVPPAARRLRVDAGAQRFEFDVSDLAMRRPV